ncbi:MAG: aminopeptidase P N-terminal domain-containing protein [Clostridia bacterium]|nr:aminopeptidase P N-terminal domain-containing protein [Clostridia bacterium]
MSVTAHREQLAELLPNKSLTVLYSGIPVHVSQDEYYPFRCNRQFFYYTGLTRENMALVMFKRDGKCSTVLYIPEADPHAIRWMGNMVMPDEAKEITGIESIRYIQNLERDLHFHLSAGLVDAAYFDTDRHSSEDLPDYNLAKAQDIASRYPAIRIMNLHPLTAKLRKRKDEEEVATIQKAIDITKSGLEAVMENLRPNMYEYQVQAIFEAKIFSEGAEGPAFPTIAGAGINGTMLHYGTNREMCKDGDLILLDLGAKIDGYCADITRTYPVNGKFTDRQRQYYEIALAANRAVAKAAKPGMTTRDLNDVCKAVLADGLIKMGKIEKPEEVGKYYMHGVSHHLGIDVHDITDASDYALCPGCVITDEPGLYIDEECIGIRIEDDLLITEEGCVCLSEEIIRTPDDIEAFMAKQQ